MLLNAAKRQGYSFYPAFTVSELLRVTLPPLLSHKDKRNISKLKCSGNSLTNRDLQKLETLFKEWVVLLYVTLYCNVTYNTYESFSEPRSY